MKIKKTLALKARFTFGTPVGSAPIESRFQRLFAWRFEFLGRCPRLDFEIAPLALRAALNLEHNALSVFVGTGTATDWTDAPWLTCLRE
jgi:hypothetical protein